MEDILQVWVRTGHSQPRYRGAFTSCLGRRHLVVGCRTTRPQHSANECECTLKKHTGYGNPPPMPTPPWRCPKWSITGLGVLYRPGRHQAHMLRPIPYAPQWMLGHVRQHMGQAVVQARAHLHQWDSRVSKCGALPLGDRIGCGVSLGHHGLETATHRTTTPNVGGCDGRRRGRRMGPHSVGRIVGGALSATRPSLWVPSF